MRRKLSYLLCLSLLLGGLAAGPLAGLDSVEGEAVLIQRAEGGAAGGDEHLFLVQADGLVDDVAVTALVAVMGAFFHQLVQLRGVGLVHQLPLGSAGEGNDGIPVGDGRDGAAAVALVGNGN